MSEPLTTLNGEAGRGLGAALCSASGRAYQHSMLSERILVWVSWGAASAVAAKIAKQKYGTIHPVYCDTSRNEHPDNLRFRRDVEAWLGQPVKDIRSPEYRTCEEVYAAKRYMSGVNGATCTGQLKKVPRFAYQCPEDVHIFGLTADETMPLCKNPVKDRIRKFESQNPELYLNWILRDEGITKADCLQMMRDAGIELPVMYRLGFDNNNCLGCVKATSPHYWNLTRKHFPDVFKRRAEQSREIGVRLVRLKGVRIFLDELPPDETERVAEDLSCGPECRAPQLDDARMQNDQAEARRGQHGRKSC